MGRHVGLTLRHLDEPLPVEVLRRSSMNQSGGGATAKRYSSGTLRAGLCASATPRQRRRTARLTAIWNGPAPSVFADIRRLRFTGVALNLDDDRFRDCTIQRARNL